MILGYPISPFLLILHRWAPTLGKGVLESTAFIGNPKIGTVELTVNTYQICILLMYNEKDELPYQEIYEGLRDQAAPKGTMYLDDDSMKQLLLTLCTKRYPLLTKKSGAVCCKFVLKMKRNAKARFDVHGLLNC